MAFGKDIFCRGIDVYNLCDTDETSVSVTTYVGHSMSTGPKVAIRRNRPFCLAYTEEDEQVIGTIDASIFMKNLNQDNFKYLTRKLKRKSKMETPSPVDVIKAAIGNGKDVIGIITLTDTLLGIIEDGTMTMTDVRESLSQLKESLSSENGLLEVEVGNSGIGHHSDSELDDELDGETCVVRRLTPTETSRLQGFPDDYTKIEGPETADAPQFKSHGNSWATPCANFVSTRMEMELRRLGHEGTIRYATCCSGIEAHSVSVRNLDWKAVFFSEIEPFPCRVLEKHYPDVPNLGDMTQIHYDDSICAISNAHKENEEYSLPSCFKEAPIQTLPFKIGELEVFSGGTPCFAKGAFVLTRNGYKPIEDIRVGEEVATHNGRFCKVLRVGKKLSNDLVEVSVVGRNKFVCTSDHPFPLVKSHRHKNGEYYFDSPSLTAIKDGQSLYAQIVNAHNEDFGIETPQLPKVYNATKSEIFELCGWYVGDGYIRGWKKRSKKAVILCLNSKDIEVFNSHFGGKINYSISRSEGIFKVQICCTELAHFLHTHFGELAYGKKIPIWAYKKEVRESFIIGYFQTDGCFTRDGHAIQWSTVSPALAYGVADIVGHTCVNKANVPKTTVICGRTVNQRNFYTVRHNDAANHFHKIGKFDCVRVREVKKLKGVKDWVYNLEVDEDHTYIVNGLVTHNCQSVSVAGKREGMAEGSGTRSSLAFHFQRIIDECRPTFTIWENVPGAFSSNGGADFIWFVNRCAESGYAMAWRVLDAQFTMTEEFPRAVPQRRRRIWLVGYKGNDWRIPSRIVFETEKALTENPPKRIPGIGFKTINKDADIEAIRNANKSKDETVANDGFLDLFASIEDTGPKAKKVSQMIPLDEFPSNGDFSKVRMVDVYEFAKKVGEPGFLGDVFRKDKKTAEVAFKQLPEYKDDFEWQQSDEARALYSKLVELEKSGELKWEGAELISPQILENIGNSGILSNGRVLTMNCHEWTSGIQLSPKTYSAWEVVMQHMDWLKANDLLPEAYDETVCGLSDVLEEDPDEKYNLSWRACFGILRRAETRGKELPPALYIALISTIRNNAGIVKWVAINGRDTKKKETDMSEREIAKLCFDKYISSVVSFDDVVAVQPNRKSEDEEEDEDDSCDDIEVDEDGNPILPDEDFGISDKETDAIIDSAAECKMSRVTRVNGIIKESAIVDMPDLPNGVINVGGGETAATLIASGDAAVGTTQDSNVIALKK